jgi:hypothetical protein
MALEGRGSGGTAVEAMKSGREQLEWRRSISDERSSVPPFMAVNLALDRRKRASWARRGRSSRWGQAPVHAALRGDGMRAAHQRRAAELPG